MTQLTIIGTSHIASESVREVQRTIAKLQPDIVALELDHARYHALTTKQKKGFGLPKVGFGGLLFYVIGGTIQKLLGKYVNMQPGAEMLAAIKATRKLRKEKEVSLCLIDQDIQVTLRRFSNQVGWKEYRRIFTDIFRGIFLRKKVMREIGIDENIDLTKVPAQELIKKLMLQLKRRYPGMYKVLVEERNIVMARRLQEIMAQHPGKTIVAVVGAGHEEGMEEILKEKEEIKYSFTFNS